MTFLPVAERELRVASRRRNTFWTRVAAALVALVIGGFIYTLQTWSVGAGATTGGELFAVLAGFCFMGALSTGVFFTSDCLGEEKRDGTIGLLFLTDLAGYDVVLGKLIASSLRSFYAIVAVFPILAVTLLMGGVTGREFWMTMISLVNAMFFSLATGLFVSAISRDSQKSMFATLTLLAVLLGGGYVLDDVFELSQFLSLSSPVFLFDKAKTGDLRGFWMSLAANQTIAWVLLVEACVLLPRLWQSTGRRVMLEGNARRGRHVRRKNFRLLEKNPVLWLVHRSPWLSIVLWSIAGIMCVLALNQVLTTGRQFKSDLGKTSTVMLVVFYILATSQASRFFVEMRRSGLLEMVAVTPLRAADVVRGHWISLARLLRLPLLVCLAAHLVNSANETHAELRRMAAATRNTPAAIAAVANNTAVVTSIEKRAARTRALVAALVAVAWAFSALLEVLALSWVGMWMGLASKSTNVATLKTIVFVLIIPWFVIILTTVSLMVSLTQSGRTVNIPWQWFSVFFSCFTAVLAMLKNAFLIVIARKRMMVRLSANNW